MSLRQAAQQALEVLLEYQPNPCLIPETQEETDRAAAFWDAITALRAALAEPDSDYERGFVDGMNLQTKGSVDKAVNRMAQNPFGDDAERYARKLHEERESYKALFTEHKPQTTHWEGCEAVHPECRKPEQGPDGISWLKRDSGHFTAPTPRKPLTDDQIVDIWAGVSMDYDDEISIIELARALERAHGIGEQHGS